MMLEYCGLVYVCIMQSHGLQIRAIGMTGHFSYGGEFTMSNMIPMVVIQGKGSASNWNSSVNYAFNSLSLSSGIAGAMSNWYGEQSRSRLHGAMGDNPIDDLQGMLDGIGTIPVLGEFADGTNGLISLGRGRKAEAALSFGAMIPFVGWGATAMKLGKVEVKALKFGGDEAINHFEKHASEIMKVTGDNAYNLKNYVGDANWIIQNGTYNQSLNGYYHFMGNSSKGKSLFGFVGVKNAGQTISTFHIKSGSQLGL